MDQNFRRYQQSIPPKIIPLKNKINDLYNRIHQDEGLGSMQSSYGVPCSDEMLVLYATQARVFEENSKPTDFNSKLKEAKRNLINNTLEDINTFSTRRKLIQFSKTFQERYCQLARYTGNDIKMPQYPKNPYIASKLVTKTKGRLPETKAERMKNEILLSFSSSERNNEISLKKFKDSLRKINIGKY